MLSDLHTNSPDPKGHTDETQYEADPLLNNNPLGWSTLLFNLLPLSHPQPGTQGAFAAEVSNVPMKTAGAGTLSLVAAFSRR